MDLIFAAVLIFLMRVADVTLGTLRIIQLVRGHRLWAGLLGFFESLIWVLAARQVLTDLDEPIKIVGYAAGYAAGTMLGGTVERWLAMGSAMVRVVSPVHTPPVYPALQEAGFPTTVVNGDGRNGPVRIVFSIVRRKQVPSLLAVVQATNPNAVVTVEETRVADLATTTRATALRK